MEEREKKPRMTLEEARQVINEQDAVILQAFCRRMEAVREVARNKEALGLPTYVPEREQEILDRARAAVPAELADYAAALEEKLMALSRAYQQSGKKYGLLGRKLGHSFSPEIHRMLGQWSEPYNYGIFQVEPEDLKDFILSGDWNGLNVTIPYKQDVMAWCDEISPEAQRIGAVNTLVRRCGKIYGYNTDYTGFRRTVEMSGAQVDGAKCIVLGSGGASKTVVLVLKDLGAREVVVVSRDGKTGCDYKGLSAHYDATIMVNTTPVGMYPDTGKSAVYPGTFPHLEWAFDLIYNPLRTNFLCQAKKADIEPVNGLRMLVAQARASAEHFLGREIAGEALEQIETALRKEKENLVLIGMPGCGKSTVGQALAARLGRKFIDMDELIAAQAGMSIPDIFAGSGEDGFRQIEMEVAESLRHETGVVIACGGGVVTREENYYALAENGRLIFLNRPIDVLPTDGRPISQSVPLTRLYAQRLPLYRSWCDLEVRNEGVSIAEVAEQILQAVGQGDVREDVQAESEAEMVKTAAEEVTPAAAPETVQTAAPETVQTESPEPVQNAPRDVQTAAGGAQPDSNWERTEPGQPVPGQQDAVQAGAAEEAEMEDMIDDLDGKGVIDSDAKRMARADRDYFGGFR